jgi:hypothetical protein
MRIKVNVRSLAHQKFMWRSEKLKIGKIRHCMARYWHADVRAKFWCCMEKYGVRVHTLNLALCRVHTHKKVCTMYTHIIMAHRVYAVLAEHRGVWLVRSQYGYMFLRDCIVNDAHRL